MKNSHYGLDPTSPSDFLWYWYLVCLTNWISKRTLNSCEPHNEKSVFCHNFTSTTFSTLKDNFKSFKPFGSLVVLLLSFVCVGNSAPSFVSMKKLESEFERGRTTSVVVTVQHNRQARPPRITSKKVRQTVLNDDPITMKEIRTPVYMFNIYYMKELNWLSVGCRSKITWPDWSDSS